MRRELRGRSAAASALLAAAASVAAVAATPARTSPLKELTVELIFGSELERPRPTSFKWSPDSSRVAFLQADGPDALTTLHAHDLRSGRTVPLTSAEGPSGLKVTSFQWSPDGGSLVAVAEGDLFLIRAGARAAPPRRLTTTEARESDARFSPDGSLIGFARDGDLWVIEAVSGVERRLTVAPSVEVLNGTVDWVYEEEFELTSAWWWSPDSSRIAFLQFDQRPVPRYPIVDWSQTHPTVEWQHYPKAGDSNATVRLGVVSASGPPAPPGDSVPPTRWIELGGGSNDFYLPRVVWTPAGRLAVQRLDREQVHLELLLCDPATGAIERLLEETDPHWLNIDDDWRFLGAAARPGGLIWGAERDGWRHLYLHAPDGRPQRRLTQGEWAVTDLAAVDEKAGWIYFTATEKDPRERHLYRIRMDGTGLTRLTREEGWHETWVAADGTFVDRFATSNVPPAVSIRKADGALVRVLDEGMARAIAEYRLGAVEFTEVPAADGTPLPAMMIRPPDMQPGRRYPVLVYVYGGPHAQVVTRNWGGARGLWHHLMAQRGFIVWSLDNRGAGGRGHAWETPLYRRMARQELSDQLDGIKYLKGLPYVEASRIGIWGWSYGGYMTLYSLFNSDVFKAGVSVAPVTDWKDYDTIYTERYLDRPADNPDGYRDSSPLYQADRLQAPLLLAHGTADDNVHMQNSVQLLEILVKGGKPVEFMLYPGQNHGIRAEASRTHLFEKITRFLSDHL